MSEIRGRKRSSSIRWVPIREMRVSDRAQRAFSQDLANTIALSFDPDALGYPVVSQRDGTYWIVDGQHRVAAFALVLGEDQEMQCEVFTELTEQEEADLFLQRDKRRAISAFDKFTIGVVAERPIEVKISEVLAAVGLVAAKSRGAGHVLAVDTLRRVYALGGEEVLTQVLLVLRDTFGDLGYGASYLLGLGLVLHRYGAKLDVEHLKAKLTALRGGPLALSNKARQIQTQTGLAVQLCHAAAFVEVYNSGKVGRKVTPFFKAEQRAVAADEEA